MRLEQSVLVIGLTVACLFAFQNCSNSALSLSGGSTSGSQSSILSVGGLDGNYLISTWTCGSKDLLALETGKGATSLALKVSGFSASLVTTFPGSCVSTQNRSLSFVESSVVSDQIEATSCSSTCSAAQCLAMAAPMPALSANEAWFSSSSKFSLIHPLSAAEVASPNLIYGAAGCKAGDVLTLAGAPQ